MRTRTPFHLLVAGALLLTGACGGDDDSPTEAATQAGSDDGNPFGETDDPAATGGGAPVALPDDACSLLTDGEIAQVAPDATNEASNGSTEGMSFSACAWNNPNFRVTLTLMGGLTAQQTQIAIGIGVDDHGGERVEIAGNDAGVSSAAPEALSLQTILGDGTIMSLDITGAGAADMQDAIVGWAEAAVGRLS